MIKNNVYYTIITLILAVTLVFAMGCKHKKTPPIDTGIETPTAEKPSGEGQPELDLESLLFTPGSKYGLETVYFDFDSSALRPDAIATLQKNAEKIKQVPNVIIQLAGHCDERGTQEYNLALGERRALAVRDYLIKLGIPASRLVTISYGEEYPADPGHDESAWAKNRRVEFNRAQ
ncbi:MAG TPA: peptidoglycan-associated lipoprotein Pal [Candidatus Hydrogenedens sp.]|nr:peptidoglycan-associated lipoprotein Pal [Candidatus Hydrogenedens sp.]HOK08352.1 peptidoglycan-associated lipoprotein Pal [Candidatus Hydrogenedens sp.]HOL20591.1 peptidoglycan-associated lipoprotein Pal [Candidatus Hydrogenedens sp.]HPP57646.1 peptidoglycan-associated lipoprotein Pal [Candidatus Hydrogenedens sp.]